MNNSTLIAPSILSSDFSNLKSEVESLEKAGADLIHLDVMDGNFVPRISFGDPVISAVAKFTSLPLEVHLMTLNSEQYIPVCKRLGVSSVIVHLESCVHLHRVIQQVKDSGIEAGIAINPATPVSAISDSVLSMCKTVLIMTVNPGWGGQKFIDQSIEKIKKTKERISNFNDIKIEVDGGINSLTAKVCKDAGATVLVAGSYISDSKDYKVAIDSLKY